MSQPTQQQIDMCSTQCGSMGKSGFHSLLCPLSGVDHPSRPGNTYRPQPSAVTVTEDGGPYHPSEQDRHEDELTAYEAEQRTRIGNAPTCDLCGGQHGSDHDCQNHDHLNDDGSCSPNCEACKDTQPNPFDVMMQRGAAIRKHGHTTQSTEVETIDITPESCKTPEGAAKVNDAMRALDNAIAEVANRAETVVQDYDNPDQIENSMRELRESVKARRDAQEAFLRAVAGR